MTVTMSVVLVACVLATLVLTIVGNVFLLLVLHQLRVRTLQFAILIRMAVGHMVYSLVFGVPFLVSLFGRSNVFKEKNNLPCNIIGVLGDSLNCFLVLEMLLYTIERYYMTKDDVLPAVLKNHKDIFHSLPIGLSVFSSMFLLFDPNTYSFGQDIKRCSWFSSRIPLVVSIYTWVPATLLAIVVMVRMLGISLRMKNTTRVMPFKVQDRSFSPEHRCRNESGDQRSKCMKVFSITDSQSQVDTSVNKEARPQRVFTSKPTRDPGYQNKMINGRTKQDLIRRSLSTAALSAPLLLLQSLQFTLHIAQEFDKENKTMFGNIISALVLCRSVIYPCLVLFKNKSMRTSLKKILCCKHSVHVPRHSFRILQQPPQPREEFSIQIEEFPRALHSVGPTFQANNTARPKPPQRRRSIRLSSLSSNMSSVRSKVMSVHHLTTFNRSSSDSSDSLVVSVNRHRANSIVSTVRTSTKSSQGDTVSLTDLIIYKMSSSS